MPKYCLKCIDCGYKTEVTGKRPRKQECPDCSHPDMPVYLTRDWRAEKAISVWHPTVDLYANKKARRR